jgi:hypothetical protein
LAPDAVCAFVLPVLLDEDVLPFCASAAPPATPAEAMATSMSLRDGFMSISDGWLTSRDLRGWGSASRQGRCPVACLLAHGLPSTSCPILNQETTMTDPPRPARTARWGGRLSSSSSTGRHAASTLPPFRSGMAFRIGDA